jgi:hypothetical protein
MMHLTQPTKMPPKSTQERLLHQRQIERNAENERLRQLSAKLQAMIRNHQEQIRLTRAS